MPLNLSFTHLAVVAVVALVVLGPERLPGVARTAGNLWREWQRVRGGLEVEMRGALNDFKEPFAAPFNDINQTVKGVVDDVKGTVGPPAPPIDVLPPLAGAPAVALTEALPSLGPSSGLVSPGPPTGGDLPELAPPADPQTFVPFVPALAHRPA